MLKICPELPKEWDSMDDVSPHWGNMTWRQKMDKFRIQNAITGRLQKLCKYTFNIYWIKMKEKEEILAQNSRMNFCLHAVVFKL